jgi:predicted DNA-binding transcriptional regulator AlpA
MPDDQKPVYAPARQVRHRYGDVSEMWIERRLRDDSGFPRPIKIGRRRYWYVSDLEQWERERAAASKSSVT